MSEQQIEAETGDGENHAEGQEHFDGWQATHAGEREVKKALRRTLFKYKLHQDEELFERAYEYIREYY